MTCTFEHLTSNVVVYVAKANNLLPSYKFAAVDRHFAFDQEWMLTSPRPTGTHSAPVCRISTTRGYVIDNSTNLTARFSGGHFCTGYVLQLASDVYQIWGGDRTVVGAANAPFKFQVWLFMLKSATP